MEWLKTSATPFSRLSRPLRSRLLPPPVRSSLLTSHCHPTMRRGAGEGSNAQRLHTPPLRPYPRHASTYVHGNTLCPIGVPAGGLRCLQGDFQSPSPCSPATQAGFARSTAPRILLQPPTSYQASTIPPAFALFAPFALSRSKSLYPPARSSSMPCAAGYDFLARMGTERAGNAGLHGVINFDR
jgi:hypothetical protein